MNLVGCMVHHNKFGSGKIENVQGNKVKIQFEEDSKVFAYPDAFECFLSLSDQKINKVMGGLIEELTAQRKIEREKKRKKEILKNRIRTLKVNPNSQAMFGFKENDRKQVLDTWTIKTGFYISGKSKGMPKLPSKLNMNTACLLTMIPEGMKEEDRIIFGVFMVKDDFIGEACTSGVIPAHKEYRMILDTDKNSIKLWDYISDAADKKKWGMAEMKYFSNTEMKQILEDMVEKLEGTDQFDKIKSFYKYFCEVNHFIEN